MPKTCTIIFILFFRLCLKVLLIHKQQFVLNLFKYFEKERAHRGPLLPFSSVQERLADALKISKKTVLNIKQRNKHKPIPSTPGKSSHHIKKKTSDLPEGQKMEVRNTLYDMYKDKKHLTLRSLKDELKHKEIVSMCKSSLNVLLKELGFTFKKDD